MESESANSSNEGQIWVHSQEALTDRIHIDLNQGSMCCISIANREMIYANFYYSLTASHSYVLYDKFISATVNDSKC